MKDDIKPTTRLKYSVKCFARCLWRRRLPQALFVAAGIPRALAAIMGTIV
ncbi:MAG: hypothetical protein PHV34_19935 [Verrucomicrobiae bacterium]|nr:hypothetical protein [Verrucomicrobiae bacterium]